jgi:hypothetical protein
LCSFATGLRQDTCKLCVRDCHCRGAMARPRATSTASNVSSARCTGERSSTYFVSGSWRLKVAFLLK